MIMPVPDGKGLDGCKEECNKNTECDAIEYAETAVSVGTDCCFLVDCGGTVPEPLNTQAPHHLGTWTYKGYVKGNPYPIINPESIPNAKKLISDHNHNFHSYFQ